MACSQWHATCPQLALKDSPGEGRPKRVRDRRSASKNHGCRARAANQPMRRGQSQGSALPQKTSGVTMPSHHRLKLLAAAISFAAAGALGATPASITSGTTFVALNQHATVLRQGDVVSGALSSAQPMHIEVALKLRNPAQLHSFIATAKQANRVAAWLRAAGFTNVQISPNRMLVSADGRADTAGAAFKTTFAQVRTKDGRMAYMHNDDVHIPASLQDVVLSVIGLQSVHQAHTFAKPMQSGYTTQAVTGHNPVEFASIYGGSGV